MKEKMKRSYKELPEGYVLVKSVDAVKDKKFAIVMNVVAFFVALIIIAGLSLLRFRPLTSIDITLTELALLMMEYCGGLILYMILHELTHGIVYKLLTKEKLRFGLSFSCAYCGVPDIYVAKRTAMASLLAPFLLFSCIFIPLCFVLNDYWSFYFILMLGMHVGGCSGDLYDTFLFLFKYDSRVLMRDTGPRQEFYEPEEK